MEELLLEVQPRKELGSSQVKKLRENGFIPGVVYAKSKESLSIKIPHRQLMQLVHQHRIENAVVTLKIKDEKKEKARACLVKEIQYDPVLGEIMHIDFNEISLTQTIKVNVPVVTKGEPVGVKQEGGSLERIIWEVEVECLPSDIPKEIEVDVSALKMGEALHIKEIAFPSKIKVLNDPEAIVLSVVAPMKEEVVAVPVEGEEVQEPEVIKEKKEAPAESEEEDKKEKK